MSKFINMNKINLGASMISDYYNYYEKCVENDIMFDKSNQNDRTALKKNNFTGLMNTSIIDVFDHYLKIINLHKTIRLGELNIGDNDYETHEYKYHTDSISKMEKRDFMNYMIKLGIYNTQYSECRLMNCRIEYERIFNSIIEYGLLTKDCNLNFMEDEPVLWHEYGQTIINTIIKSEKYASLRNERLCEISRNCKSLKDSFMKKFKEDLMSDNPRSMDNYTKRDLEIYMFLLYDDHELHYRKGYKGNRLNFREDTESYLDIYRLLYKYQVYLYNICIFRKNYEELITNRFISEKHKILNNPSNRYWKGKILTPESSDNDFIEYFMDKYQKKLFGSSFKSILYDSGIYNPYFYYFLKKKDIRIYCSSNIKLFSTIVCIDRFTPLKKSDIKPQTLKDMITTKFKLLSNSTEFVCNKSWNPTTWSPIFKIERMLGIHKEKFEFLDKLTFNK